ncbi:MAG: hypothetical protein OXR66_01785 [Candidatus Woesearchaeota archaeon]|nr:hypothetical protein [Candidatus Woesearchaeota archaeon]
MRDYIKAGIANRVTCAGYIALTTCATVATTGAHFYDQMSRDGKLTYIFAVPLLMLTSAVLLGATDFARDTVREYRATRRDIARNGRPGAAQLDKLTTAHYCNRVGIRLAIREARLEHLL